MTTKAKTITATLFILGVLGAVAAGYLWNKPHQDVAGASGIKTEAAALYKAFTTDSVAAKKNYTQQVLEVSGAIGKISKNQQGQTIVLIKSGNDGAYINCTMEEQGDSMKEGDSVSIKGICNGLGQGDADLGIMGDVYLVRCYLIK